MGSRVHRSIGSLHEVVFEACQTANGLKTLYKSFFNNSVAFSFCLILSTGTPVALSSVGAVHIKYSIISRIHGQSIRLVRVLSVQLLRWRMWRCLLCVILPCGLVYVLGVLIQSFESLQTIPSSPFTHSLPCSHSASTRRLEISMMAPIGASMSCV